MSEFKYMNSSKNSGSWAAESIYMKSYMNSVLWRILWIHGWISRNEFTYEIMVEFINFTLFWVQLQICFSEGKCFTCLLFQRNHHLFFAVSSLPALSLLRCCYGRRLMLCSTTEWGGHGGLMSTWWMSLASRSAWPACQQRRKLWNPSSWEGSTSRTISRLSN